MSKKSSKFGKIVIYIILAILLLGVLGNFLPNEQEKELPASQTQEETRTLSPEDTRTKDSKETEFDHELDQPETKEADSQKKDDNAQEPSDVKNPNLSNSDQTQAENNLSFKENDKTQIPPYAGEMFAIINDNIPFFSPAELTTTAYESYSKLDSLGRCGAAVASCGKEIMPASDEKRGSISSIFPSGWVQAKYNGISGGYLYNRCHLLGWQLSAENANPKNLITGTRSFNVDGMLPFENMVADYIKETGNHVAYRVSPLFEGNNLVASGVRMEAYSIEDQGDGICFHVFVYNVQAGITIDYSSGKSSVIAVPSVTTTKAPATTTAVPQTTSTVPVVTTQSPQGMTYILNTNTKKIHRTTCRHVSSIKESNRQSFSGDISSLYGQGYATCKTCF